jgi:hypothetical protein
MPILLIAVRWRRVIGWVCKPEVTGSIPVRSTPRKPVLMRVLRPHDSSPASPLDARKTPERFALASRRARIDASESRARCPVGAVDHRDGSAYEGARVRRSTPRRRAPLSRTCAGYSTARASRCRQPRAPGTTRACARYRVRCSRPSEQEIGVACRAAAGATRLLRAPERSAARAGASDAFTHTASVLRSIVFLLGRDRLQRSGV